MESKMSEEQTPEIEDQKEDNEETCCVNNEDGIISINDKKPEELSVEEIADLQEKARERDKIFAQYQRLGADFSNYQKRMVKEKVRWTEDAKKDILMAFLPILDNFARALETSHKAKAKDILHGVEMIIDHAETALKDKGLQEIEAVGALFDPNLHEAVLQEENEDHPNMTITEEFQKGYMFNDSVLRHSKVKVSKNPNQ